jgi:hypothetical protein
VGAPIWEDDRVIGKYVAVCAGLLQGCDDLIAFQCLKVMDEAVEFVVAGGANGLALTQGKLGARAECVRLL